MALNIHDLLGNEVDSLLNHTSKTITKEQLTLPGSDFTERVFMQTNRNPQVLRSIESLYNHGRLGGTGYVSILPVDQGIEHSAGASFAPNPAYFDPENIIKLAFEGHKFDLFLGMTKVSFFSELPNSIRAISE